MQGWIIHIWGAPANGGHQLIKKMTRPLKFLSYFQVI